MSASPCIKVTSISFSHNPILRDELLATFPNAMFNETKQRFTGEGLVDYLHGAEGAIVGLEAVDRAVLDACPDLQIISKYGVGLDSIDVDYAKSSGRAIGWSGGVNKRSVSELALAFIMGLCRNVFVSGGLLKSGQWVKDGGFQLSGKTVGLIGCGFVGEDLLKLLQPFGCRLLVNDILDKSAVAQQYGATQVDLDTLVAESDVVSLHIPFTPETDQLVSAEFLTKMQNHAFLVNTSRGPVVDEAALATALQNNQIGGAGLDVFVEEPPTDFSLINLPNVMATPHIGGNAAEAVLAMGRSAIHHLQEHFLGSSS